MYSSIHMSPDAPEKYGDRRGGHRMVAGFTFITSAYHHYSCEFESRSWQGVLGTAVCDKVCQWLVADRWFSPGTPVSSTFTTDHHYIIEILLKVVLNTIALTLKTIGKYDYYDQISPPLLKLILRVTRNILQKYWWTHKNREI